MLKWELLIPVIILGGLGTGLTELDESAGLAALYTLIIEVYVYKDLSLKKDLPRIAKASMGLAGAVILILAMANALINYVIQQAIPAHVLDFMLQLGLDRRPGSSSIVMNVFLLVLGMLMDGFSAILVAVPLILPFAARFTLGPFHLAMIFLLNLEIAYCCPPLGLNLFISSFRFNRPGREPLPRRAPVRGDPRDRRSCSSATSRRISNVFVAGHLRPRARRPTQLGVPPREAWLLECVQEDRSNPLPCTPADRLKWPHGEAPAVVTPTRDTTKAAAVAPSDSDDDALLKQMMGGAPVAKPSGSAAPAPDDDDALLLKMMGGAAKDAGKAGTPAPAADDEEELLRKMGVPPKQPGK